MENISDIIKDNYIYYKIISIFHPFKLVFGFLFLVLSTIAMSCTMTTLITKIITSKCGIKCLFKNDFTEMVVPSFVDLILEYMSSFIHLDSLHYFGLMLYLFFSSIYGVFVINNAKKGLCSFHKMIKISFLSNLLSFSFPFLMANVCPFYFKQGPEKIKVLAIDDSGLLFQKIFEWKNKYNLFEPTY